MESIKKYIPLFILLSLVLADIIMYAGLIKMFFNSSPTIIAGVIAFIGAIIGGFLTLVGVDITLKNQYRREFLESYPSKLMKADFIVEKSLEINRVCRESQRLGKYEIIKIELEHFFENRETLLEKAAEASDELYKSLNKISHHYRSWYHLLNNVRAAIDEWGAEKVHDMIQDYNDRSYELTIEILSSRDRIVEKYKQLNRYS